MRKPEAIDKDVRSTMTNISAMFCETGGTVKKLVMGIPDTRGYLFKTKGGSICVVSIPSGLTRPIITVANPRESKGVNVPPYVKGVVSDYLVDNIIQALDILKPMAGSAEYQLQTLLRR